MLGDDIARALPELRAHAESMMRDTCTVTRPRSAEETWNDVTGTYEAGVPPVIYSGMCRVRNSMANPQAAEAGEAEWAADLVYISLPVATSAGVMDGDVVTITACAYDPVLVDMVATVVGGHAQTHSTARRLPCRVVSRDA